MISDAAVKSDATVLAISGWAHPGEALRPVLEHFYPGIPSNTISVHDLHPPEGQRSSSGPSEYAKAAAVELDRLGSTRSIVVGWSMGGMIALELAKWWPEKVSELLLLSSTSRFCKAADYDAGSAQSELRLLMRGVERETKQALRSFFVRSASPDAIENKSLAAKISSAEALGLPSLLSALHYLNVQDLRPILSEVKCPTIIYHGDSDQVISPTAAQFLASHLPDCRLHILKDRGHDIHGV